MAKDNEMYIKPSQEEIDRQLNDANDKIHAISKRSNPRFVPTTNGNIIEALTLKGRELVSIDSALMSMYIKDNLDQTYLDLVTRLSLELDYNFIDVHGYLKDKVLWYNRRDIDNYNIEIWEVEKVLPSWVVKLMENPSIMNDDFKALIREMLPRLRKFDSSILV